LIYNGSQKGRPPGVEIGFATLFYTPLGFGRPIFSTRY
jgi:hypothetical protein